MFHQAKKLALASWLSLAVAFAVGGCGEGSAGTDGAAGQPERSSAPKTELTISAASSLAEALKVIQAAYESQRESVRLRFNFGASGALRQQIEQGAPVDLFVSASKPHLSALVAKRLVDPGRQTDLLTNELVVVVPADGRTVPARLEDLAKPEIKKIALGEPATVPAGTYALEALANAKLRDVLEPKIVLGKDVRQVLTYVETGNADAGFVYKSEAIASKKVKTAFGVDPNMHQPILYPVGIINTTGHAQEAERFYHYLQSKEALDIFSKYGFGARK